VRFVSLGINQTYQLCSITSLQSRLLALESTNADLTAQLISTQSQLSVVQTQLARHDEERGKREEREKAERQAEVGTLRQKLTTYADYDEIKRELEIMKVSRRTRRGRISNVIPHTHLIVCRIWWSRRRYLRCGW
jgi:predicted RNase H-like nuclease (RuvC/YqgF family)